MISPTLTRSLAAAALVPALGVGLASSAAAAPDKLQSAQTVSARSCSAAGGVFTRAPGARSCTTVQTVTTDDPPVERERTLMTASWSGGSARHALVGTSFRRSTAVTTTTRTQSASRVVTASSTVERTSTVVPVSCTERVTTSRSGYTDRASGSWVEGTSETTDTPMALQRCEHDHLFVA